MKGYLIEQKNILTLLVSFFFPNTTKVQIKLTTQEPTYMTAFYNGGFFPLST